MGGIVDFGAAADALRKHIPHLLLLRLSLRRGRENGRGAIGGRGFSGVHGGGGLGWRSGFGLFRVHWTRRAGWRSSFKQNDGVGNRGQLRGDASCPWPGHVVRLRLLWPVAAVFGDSEEDLQSALKRNQLASGQLGFPAGVDLHRCAEGLALKGDGLLDLDFNTDADGTIG